MRIQTIPGNGHDQEPPRSQLRFTAPSGERNVVSIEREAAGTWLVRDAGATLSTGAGCVSIEANSARCSDRVGTLPGSPTAVIDSGDLADQVTLARPAARTTTSSTAGPGATMSTTGRDAARSSWTSPTAGPTAGAGSATA